MELFARGGVDGSRMKVINKMSTPLSLLSITFGGGVEIVFLPEQKNGGRGPIGPLSTFSFGGLFCQEIFYYSGR